MKRIESKAREMIAASLKAPVHAPNFGPDKRWLNTKRPLTLKQDLAGKVVLIDFWTFCCVNCHHVLEDLRAIEDRFDGQAFAVIGCHSAKFDHEHDAAEVRQAILRHDIRHPVVVDDGFDIWSRYAVRAWPTLVLVSPDGYQLGEVSGEGHRELLEAMIAAALEIYGERGALDDRPLPIRTERTGTLARELSFPGNVLADLQDDRLFISDTGHHRVIVTTRGGDFVRSFGDGMAGLLDGPADTARFRQPHGMARVGDELFVADTGNHAIRAIDLATGSVRTVVGGKGPHRERAGSWPLSTARLCSPWDLAVRDGVLYVAMAGSHQIWRISIDEDLAEIFAGDGAELHRGGEAHTAAFAQPSGLAVIGDTLYVADAESSTIRAIELNRGRVTTVAGGSANPADLFHFGDEEGIGPGHRFQHPLGLCARGEQLFVADSYNHKIKQIDLATQSVTTCAGRGAPGREDGAAEDASFHEPGGVSSLGELVFVADTNSHRIRVIDTHTDTVSTIRLRNVPIPLKAVQATGRHALARPELPQLPHTAFPAAGPFQVPPGPTMVHVRVQLPEGATFTEDAPSQFRAVCLGGAIDVERPLGPLDRSDVLIPVTVDGPGRLEVRGLYYFTLPGDVCHVRSVRWNVELDIDPKGSDQVELTDNAAS